MANRSLIVAGNCQSNFLCRALQESPELSEDYDIIYFRNFRKNNQGELKAKDVARCAILLEQIAHKAPELPHQQDVPGDCRIVRFPILWGSSLWPTMIDDPRSTPEPDYPGGRFPYGDRLILEFLNEGLTPEQAVDRFFASPLDQLYDLPRFHEINLKKAEFLDERAEVPLARDVFDRFVDTKMFETRNHPSVPLLFELRQKIFEAIGVEPPKSDLVEASGGMGHIQVPVHPSVASHFGLKWYDPNAAHRFHTERLAAREYYLRYAANSLAEHADPDPSLVVDPLSN